jgi:hypothetical protein
MYALGPLLFTEINGQESQVLLPPIKHHLTIRFGLTKVGLDFNFLVTELG